MSNTMQAGQLVVRKEPDLCCIVTEVESYPTGIGRRETRVWGYWAHCSPTDSPSELRRKAESKHRDWLQWASPRLCRVVRDCLMSEE